jgi:hypothetical protein
MIDPALQGCNPHDQLFWTIAPLGPIKVYSCPALNGVILGDIPQSRSSRSHVYRQFSDSTRVLRSAMHELRSR